MTGPEDFIVAVLTYGDHLDLIARCLSSLLNNEAPIRVPFVIGANEPSQAVMEYLGDIQAQETHRGRQFGLIISSANRHKYPMMRDMLTPFYGGEPDGWPSRVMWFDDDSFIRFGPHRNLFEAADEQMADADVLGQIWTKHLVGNQAQWIEDQPWYGHQPVKRLHNVRFAQGAWWCARTSVLAKYNWPVPELDHRGGDVMFGELCRQQGLRLKAWREKIVAINADETGRDSQSRRRGFDSRPIGFDDRRP
jgi:hypothetical protein